MKRGGTLVRIYMRRGVMWRARERRRRE
jgi:hypothetical protein